MSAKEDATDTHGPRPGHQGQPQDEVNWGDKREQGGEHHGPGGVARGEAELVHQLDRGVLVVNIVAGAATPGEGLNDGDHGDIQEEGEQKVEEKGSSKRIKPGGGDKQPWNAMTGYLKS